MGETEWEKLGLALLGRILLSKALIQLSADGWSCAPSLLVIWPEATQSWGLLQLYDRVNGNLQEDFHQGRPSRTVAVSASIPVVSPWQHTPPQGDPPALAGSSGSVFHGVTAPCLWVLMSTKFPLYPLRLCFVKSCGSPVIKPHWPSRPDSLGFPVLFWIPRLGSLTWGSKPPQQWESFFGDTVPQFVGRPPDGYGIWFFPADSVNGCSTASCGFGALARGDEHTSFYPTILNLKTFSACFWLSLFFFLLFC